MRSLRSGSSRRVQSIMAGLFIGREVPMRFPGAPFPFPYALTSDASMARIFSSRRTRPKVSCLQYSSNAVRNFDNSAASAMVSMVKYASDAIAAVADHQIFVGHPRHEDRKDGFQGVRTVHPPVVDVPPLERLHQVDHPPMTAFRRLRSVGMDSPSSLSTRFSKPML